MGGSHANELCALKKLKFGCCKPDMSVIGSKWLYEIQFDGSTERIKAKLVAQGYSQISGIDFDETFPIIKPTIIILAIAVTNSWQIHQLDIKNVFLNGYLKETVLLK